jgi:putative hydrolase of the HAD superfamily
LNKAHVTWVVFDYGGVVSHQPSQQDQARLARAAGAAVPAFMEAYRHWRLAYDLAELDAGAYWQQVGRSLGRNYDDAEVAELTQLDRAAWLRLQAGTVALIEDLSAAGRRLAMLSNAPGDLAEAVTGLPVSANFEHLMFSCELKSAKPDPECYRQALARIRARADEVIFVDDSTDNVAAAAALGLRAIHFTTLACARAAVTAELEASV